MASISEIRQKYPQYDDLSDEQLADAMHRKFYSDMPRADFDAKIGFKPVAGQHLSFEEGQAMLDQENRAERMQGGSGSFGAAATSYINGMPVAGPMLLGATQRGAAALSSAVNGKGYDENLKEAQALTQAAQEAHLKISTTAGVTGAVAGTLPMVIAAPAAFGAGGGGLIARSALSSLGGTVVGGTDAAVRSGGNLEDTGWGAAAGFGLGAAGPTVGKMIGAGARKVMDAYRTAQAAKAAGTKSATVAKLAKMIGGDGFDEAAMRTRLGELGPEGMIADLGPNAQTSAAAIAAKPGRGQEVVRSALEARRAGANARVSNVIEETMGRNVVPSFVDKGIKANQGVLGPEYQRLFKGVDPYDFQADRRSSR